jgi:CBS domain-containing protein
MAAAEAISTMATQFLIGYAPFSRMARADLKFLAEHLRLAYFPVGAVIVDSAAGYEGQLHIIQRGHVRAQRAGAAGSVCLGPGECFPLLNASGGELAAASFVATEDVFCYQLPHEFVEALRQRSAIFEEFCTADLKAVLKESLSSLHGGFIGRAVAQETLLRPLSALVRRAPVHCTADTPVREALLQMSREGVRTIVVVDPRSRPLGIFTLTDLMERIVLPGRHLSTAIGTVMTEAPACLEQHASAQDAMALMAARGLHQVLVTREMVLTGVISERDLFALQRASIRNVLQTIRVAHDPAELKTAASEIASLTDNLMAQGIAAEHLTRIITALHDGMTARLLELLAPRFSLDGIRYCWLALGSEGRLEQNVASDQDNALVFAAEAGEAAGARARLLPFADAVNEALAALGFPLCTGNIMARNPECCLSLGEWRTRFDAWLREPTPEALLNANIFFDFRALAGAAELAEQLRSWVLARTADNRLFLGLLAANALRAEPPLGLIRAFRTDDGRHPGTIDLKTQGTRLFVDAARVLALAFGIAETHTVQRLRQGARRLNLPERDLAGLVQAFEFLQLLRFRAHTGALNRERDVVDAPPVDGHAPPDLNCIDPYALSDPDQRLLKECFRQARSVQLLLQQFIPH